jgi:hypothetical protein
MPLCMQLAARLASLAPALLALLQVGVTEAQRGGSSTLVKKHETQEFKSIVAELRYLTSLRPPKTGIRTTTSSKDAETAAQVPLLKKDHKTRSGATMRKEGETDVQPEVSKKGEKLDSPFTMLKSDEKTDAKSPSAENGLLSEHDLKLTKLVTRAYWEMQERLVRELELLERLERKEKKRLEEGDWYP